MSVPGHWLIARGTRRCRSVFLLVLWCVAGTGTDLLAQWPQFRGPTGAGVGEGAGFYMVKTGGIVTTLDPATGTLLKEGRATGALGDYYASPVAADGKSYLANRDGQVSVLEAGAEWKLLAVNDLGEEISATPALVNGRVYVRTRDSIYCFTAEGGRSAGVDGASVPGEEDSRRFDP